MDHIAAANALTALGHPGRLAVFRLLARRAPGGVRPIEIAEALDLKQNTLSVHVTTLARAGLIDSERIGRSVFYRVDLGWFADLTHYLVADCCRGRPEVCASIAAHAFQRPGHTGKDIAERTFNVLFLCTGNSARSIFAEAILAKEGAGRFRAYSAGTRPYAEVNRHAHALLKQLGHDTEALRPKDISAVFGPSAPRLDFVITVCDRAANEECPSWPGHPICAHWGMPDPVRTNGTDAERILALREAYRTMQRRVAEFVALPIASLDRMAVQARLDAIGQLEAPAGEAVG